jgi:uncharacterized membrane protein
MIDIAHVHPMLVHFPIVLLMFGVGLDFLALARGADLSGAECLPRVAASALILGTVAAAAAAVFGDIALDKAVDLGFPKAPLEHHEALGLTTLWIFVALSALRILAYWKGFRLRGGRGVVLAVLGLCGVGVLLFAAYAGGKLVYEIGVNVAAVKP